MIDILYFKYDWQQDARNTINAMYDMYAAARGDK